MILIVVGHFSVFYICNLYLIWDTQVDWVWTVFWVFEGSLPTCHQPVSQSRAQQLDFQFVVWKVANMFSYPVYMLHSIYLFLLVRRECHIFYVHHYFITWRCQQKVNKLLTIKIKSQLSLRQLNRNKIPFIEWSNSLKTSSIHPILFLQALNAWIEVWTWCPNVDNCKNDLSIWNMKCH